MHRIFIGLILALAPLAAQEPAPDKIQLKNGDLISGRILSLKDGKLLLETAGAGKITLSWDAIRTFETKGTHKVVLEDGTVLERRITPGEGETVKAPGTGLHLPAIPLARITSIDPPPPPRESSVLTPGPTASNL